MKTLATNLIEATKETVRAARPLGVLGALWFSWQKGRFLYSATRPTTMFRLRSRRSRYPLLCRPGTSDFEIFRQIFIEQEYQPLDELNHVNFVIDCGAYVGYSASYFLTRFPECHLVAIEPDASNFDVLQHNLSPYGPRVELIHAGIWSHSTFLVLDEKQSYRSGRECTRQVRECSKTEKLSFPAIDIETLLQRSGRERIDILKLDIEGAEVMVFGNCRSWLDRVDNIVIELHDDTHFGKASDIFFAACKDRFDFSRSGERVVAKRRSA